MTSEKLFQPVIPIDLIAESKVCVGRARIRKHVQPRASNVLLLCSQSCNAAGFQSELQEWTETS